MEVGVVNSTTITLDNSQTNPTEIPFTIFDKFAANMHIAILYAFAPPTPTNSAIKEGLSKALHHFPTLAGRVGENDRHRPCLLISGEGGGALVVEATVASDLADHIPIQPSPQLLLLHPSEKEPTHLLQIQLNRFRCGGLVIGVTAHHWVADGQSMSSFFIAWGKLVRGVDLDRLPAFDRSWLQPRQPPRSEFQHWGVEFISRPHPNPSDSSSSSSSSSSSIPIEKLCNISLHYSWEFITSELKANILPEKYTTFETLLGHVWRKMTMARGIQEEKFTQIRVAVNGRPRLRPRVSPEFFGNLVLNAFPRARVKDLLGGGVAGAARLIHEAICRIDADYFQSFIDFGALHEDDDLMPYYDDMEAFLCPNLEADSWLGFGFQELDLGCGGGLCAFIPTWVPLEGVIIFIPPLGGDEGSGVCVIITMFEEHARLLKQISHSLE